ncbi:ribonuclease H-like domain-containing protein [Tanacetum coccineum]
MRVQELTIFIDSQLVTNQVNGLFEESQTVIKQYLEKAKELLANFPCHLIEHIKRDQNKKADALSKLALMTFFKLAKEVLVEVIQDKLISQKEVANVTQEKEDSPRSVVSKIIRLGYYWPSMHKDVKGIQNNSKSSNGETPFSLVYGSEAVVPIEISIETRRIQDFDPRQNEKRRKEYLDILEEKKEIASIKEAHYKQKLEGYYNKRVRPSTFKPGDYDLWSMRMEQYLTHTYYALWEVIVKGDAPAVASSSIEGPIPPKTAEQKLVRKNELKAKSTLLLAIPDEHILKFHGIKDAKTLWEAIKTRFGDNKESKKMQKAILKQQYENFAA